MADCIICIKYDISVDPIKAIGLEESLINTIPHSLNLFTCSDQLDVNGLKRVPVHD